MTALEKTPRRDDDDDDDDDAKLEAATVKMAQVFLDILYSFGNCLNCFPGSPTLKINSRSFKILRLLGEGGFSYVYLVQDTATAELFALKKIRCPFGAESVAQAMREVEAYKLFANTLGIIHSVDYAVTADRGGGTSGIGGGDGDQGAKTVYVLLPYYRRGNLQDMINANLVNHTRFPERQLLALFAGVCRALRHMHKYRPRAERMTVPRGADGVDENAAGADDEDEEAQQRPLMEAEDVVSGGAVKSYAHRDIKPGTFPPCHAARTPAMNIYIYIYIYKHPTQVRLTWVC